MRLFVTGGTGAIGGYAVPALVGAGHQVRALARGAAKAATLSSQGAVPVEVSLFDREGLTRAFAGCDAVVNLASALPSTAAFIRKSAWADCERIRTEGAAAVVDAADAAGVGAVVQESVVMIYRDQGAAWIDEDAPVDHYPISAGNHAAEASARRFDGTGVVLRFGLFYGPGAAHSQQMMDMARRHVLFRAGRPASYVSSIHLFDAAAAVVSALDVPGGTYNVVDDEPLTKREHAAALSRAVGERPWIIGPGRAAELLGNRTTSLTRSVRASNARLRAASSWRPTYSSVREGYSAMAAESG
ncbi:NAD(P)-dependent oxidoreductase [Gordonia sp. TBRC 11910]|uniref:NAD(P)-dependent oxidoreductase n=1 Tax=Gordonia asplenii TaxID=2725283 RepID=A0A848L0T3_9ACTN|nr:NAD(P)-dependent oxidoreductase [Gordonia asplenii]NMO02685.1 NAD(P)-dependent oxidoreductase [Gordonia asplenii]